ncbi:methyltransferase domain-containing protein [Dactylosporangium aurantiacum]|uniref:Methyltransferase domain-containing protein n=1 Tax=Dactylosporangium aurantiacum TaxID=35754 RepID=A0A9Q9I9I5_9ACTN|nr:methyltransferase domain-containing protein [Dactylosporangium aurantiacum]MDG6105154.1 methyltransferase domain-containing protein [Dactylosporangium aurantiacum]UWZ51676.1 methyltransferase domain-containing protein [Dactylosporangium aurantiacum]
MADFDTLLAEGASVPVEGWDFAWFAGRATEERPPWGYAGRLADRYRTAAAALDVQTGGGEVVRWALRRAGTVPGVLAATESWAPNAALARRALAPYGGTVALVADEDPLPFADDTFDLVSSRHPVVTDWAQIARVLRPGGTYLAQHVGVGTAHEVTEALLGPTPVAQGRHPAAAAAAARAAGLLVTDLREATLRLEFFDVAAVVVFLRKVIWIVPGFTVAAHRERLRALHERIEAEGPFVAHTTRYLIECSKPHRDAIG